jgi:hypothetical protein
MAIVVPTAASKNVPAVAQVPPLLSENVTDVDTRTAEQATSRLPAETPASVPDVAAVMLF